MSNADAYRATFVCGTYTSHDNPFCTHHRPRCFLDMDGVLINFVKGVCEAHNMVSPYSPYSSFYDAARGKFDMEKIWGISAEVFWSKLDGPTFWENLEPMPDALEIVDLVIEKFGADNICVLTAPSLSPYCVPGKRICLKNHFPQLKHILFGRSKQFLAYSGAYLIDDKDSNVEEFVKGGGWGILLPRPWNSQWDAAANALGFLKFALALAGVGDER